MNQSIQELLNQLLPIGQMNNLATQAVPYFLAIAALIVFAGVAYHHQGSNVHTFAFAIYAVAAVAISPYLLLKAEQIAGGLVGAIGNLVPGLNWLIVNNTKPGAGPMMDFTKPFGVIAQYIGGTFTPNGNVQWWEVGKIFDYLTRIAAIMICGAAACITVFIVEVLLILQDLILVFSVPLLPVFVATLFLPSGHGTGVNFIKHLIGVLSWPIGWAIGHIATMAVLQNLQVPSWTASLGQIVLTTAILAGVCFWMVTVAIGAPALIAAAIVRGDNFAQSLATHAAAGAGKHAENAIQSAGTVGGALAGSYGGPGGVTAGAARGGVIGGVASMPISSMNESVEAMNGGRRALPSSRSRGAADLAVKGIKARA